MFQTLSYIGILISELAQRTARRGSRNATKRRSKITYSIMTLAAKPTHNNQKKKGKPHLCRTVYPYRQIPQRFTCVHQGYPSNHAHLLRTSFAPNVLRASRTSRAQSLLRTLSAYYAALRTAARYTGIRLQRAAPPPGNGGSFSLATSTNSSALLHPRHRKCHLRHIFARHP